jgi:hypothetical protein
VTSRNLFLLPTLALSLMGLSMKAQSAPSATVVVSCKASELPQHPFPCDGLLLTIIHFRSDASIGSRTVGLQLTNPTSGFRPFQSSDLIAVGTDGHQAMLGSWAASEVGVYDLHAPSGSTGVAPGAMLSLNYVLEQSAKLSAKLYLGERLIAEITD